MTLADATTFHNAISNSINNNDGTFEIPCSTDVAVKFVIGGGHYAVDMQDLLNPTYNGNGDMINCQSSVVGMDQTNWILGSPFLRNVSKNKCPLT